MENNLLKSLEKAVKNWWISLIIGVLAVALGIICLFTPFTAYTALVLLFVCSFFVGGIAEIVFAVSNRDSMKNWGWTLAVGIIDLIFAIFLIMHLELAPLMLAYIIAFWFMLQSFWGIGISFDLQPIKGSGWGWLLVLSILGVLTSIILLFQPVIAGLFATYIISFGFTFYGIFRIYLAFRLKHLHKFLNENK